MEDRLCALDADGNENCFICLSENGQKCCLNGLSYDVGQTPTKVECNCGCGLEYPSECIVDGRYTRE
jgi:hypothetical protein